MLRVLVGVALGASLAAATLSLNSSASFAASAKKRAKDLPTQNVKRQDQDMAVPEGSTVLLRSVDELLHLWFKSAGLLVRSGISLWPQRG